MTCPLCGERVEPSGPDPRNAHAYEPVPDDWAGGNDDEIAIEEESRAGIRQHEEVWPARLHLLTHHEESMIRFGGYWTLKAAFETQEQRYED